MKTSRTIALLTATAVAVLPGIARELSFSDSLFMKGEFVICGNIAPSQGHVLSFAVSDMVTSGTGYDADTDSTGNFSMKLPVTGPLQQMFIYRDNVITVPVCPDDTVKVSIDDSSNIAISGSTPGATLDMQLAKQLHKHMRQRFIDINIRYYDVFYKNSTDSAKRAFISDIDNYVRDYHDIVETFSDSCGTPRNIDYFMNSGYYDIMNFIANTPYADSVSVRTGESWKRHVPIHKRANQRDLLTPAFRTFITNYMNGIVTRAEYTFVRPCNTPQEQQELWRAKVVRGIAPDDLTADFADLRIVEKLLRSGSYWNSEDELTDYFLNANTTDSLRAAIAGNVTKMKLSRAGCMSPKLSLTGLDGRRYTLDDFRGKYLLLDFWFPGCGPCRSEFEIMPEFKEHFAKYADKINYVTVCRIGKHPSERKSMEWVISHYNMDDLNTILNITDSDELYDINTAPTYVLLDPDGRIVDFNLDRPSSILMMSKQGIVTDFEKALRGELTLPDR